MSKLPKPPFEISLSRKRNVHPQPSKSAATANNTATTFLTASDFGGTFSRSNSSTGTDIHYMKNDPQVDTTADSPRIGDRVVMDGKQVYGTLRFLGPTEFKSGIWAGVELDHYGTGKNDGSVQGIYYFRCAPNNGIFVLASKIALVRQKSTINNKKTDYMATIPSSISSSTTTSSLSSSSTLYYSSLRKHQVETAPSPPSSPKGYSIMEEEKAHVDWYQQEIGNYKVKLGREQHKVHQLLKEREQLMQQVIQERQESRESVQKLQVSVKEQSLMMDQLNNSLEQAHITHKKESTQLMEQQSQLIHQLQQERLQHDATKSCMRSLEQACQSLINPFDVRPGLTLLDQLTEAQRQVNDLLEKVRIDTSQQNQQRRVVNALQRDVANLETLIETKVFKEEELVESLELERQYNLQLKNELKQVKKNRRKGGKLDKLGTKLNGRNNTHGFSVDSASMMSNPRWTIYSGESTTTCSSSFSCDDDDDTDLPSYCEICEIVGHDLMTCLYVMDDPSSKPMVDYSTLLSPSHMGTNATTTTTTTPIHHRNKALPPL
ncbi:hypothetical protein [Absidia glauca]|uniref:CAP-Gly domain-containing protein n=1 Tax=Absidia glauca TaxID=4829 RepID=A0A163J8U9_ABSGL|nr:hypothetical protein [Absidia glauca]